MAGFDLSNYRTVPERIAEARALYPDGRFQTELLVLPPALADKFVAVKARFFRCESDPIPAEGVAWEVVPGRTPYTKDSELQNAETSAWGRALVAAFAVDASKGIASREEVQNRQPEPRPRSGGKKVTPTPQPSETDVKAPGTNGNPVDAAVVQIVTRLKTELLERLAGDKPKAKMIWRETLSNYGLGPDDLPSLDMLEGIEADLRMAIVESLKVEVAQIMDPVELGQEPLL